MGTATTPEYDVSEVVKAEKKDYATDRVPIEHEVFAILYAIEDLPRAPVEVVLAIDAKGLIPLDPASTMDADSPKDQAEVVRPFIADHHPQAAIVREDADTLLHP